ncbi:MAG: NADH-quinone oxidoreductase subunit H [Candidatus Omnitrophica bacterium]|nr:NADH-quinone oxidoreductase subunit H [Candidatus Omnitrophota bacterium]
MMKILEYLFLFLVFPGFAFSATMGLFAGWVDRRLTARVQWRVGPPWYQNFLDVIKLLFYKETLIPEGVSKAIFLGMPLLSLASATLVSTMILVISPAPGSGFIGDLIVVIYLLMIPAISLMLGGFASENPLASLGASREMKLMLSYELPFVIAVLVPVIKSGYAIRLGDIMMHQAANGNTIASASGVISFIVMLLCVQAKLGFTPFDIAEAETEIMAGTYIEYSGKALGIFKLAKAVMLFALPILMIILYFGGITFSSEGIIRTVIQYVIILALIVVIKNTNPRVRIDHAVKFFWGPVTALAVIAAALAYLGR